MPLRPSPAPLLALAAVLLALVALATPASSPAAPAPAGSTLLLSGATNLADPLPTTVGDSTITKQAASHDGLLVAFASTSDGLLDIDDDTVSNVYVKDRSTGAVELVSRRAGANGEPAHGDCGSPAISADGNRVAFRCADRLDPVADTNDFGDVYVRDLSTDETILVSRAGNLGPVGKGSSFAPAINANGKYVAFVSNASGLDPDGQGFGYSVYHRHIGGGNETTLVSRPTGAHSTVGTGEDVAIDDTGNLVAFSTGESFDATADTNNGISDVYLRNVPGATTTLISRKDGDGAVGNGSSTSPAIAGNGTAVAFESRATNFDNGADPKPDRDVYRRQLSVKSTVLISVTINGAKGVDSHSASMDRLGRYVTFVTSAALDPDDPGVNPDAYLKDTATGVLRVLSRVSGLDGPVADTDTTDVMIAADAKDVVMRQRYGALSSMADSNRPSVITRGLELPYASGSAARPPGNDAFLGQGGEAGNASLSDDGRYAAFATDAPALLPDNVARGIVVRDRVTGETTFVSRRDGVGGTPFAEAKAPSISADGGRVAFIAERNEFHEGDVVVRDLATGRTFLASRPDGTGTAVADGLSTEAKISGDGRRVAFVSRAANLGDGDTDDGQDVHVRAVDEGRTLLASVANGPNGEKGNFPSFAPDINRDGTRVAFVSGASNLADGDKDTQYDVHLRDLAAGTTRLVSATAAGVKSNGYAGAATSLDAAGDRVAFDVDATNFPGGDEPGHKVYVRDLAANTLVLAGRGDGADGKVADSRDAKISPDGRYVAFDSSEPLAPGMTDDQQGAYRRDLALDRTELVSRAPDGRATTQYAPAGDITEGGGCVSFRSEENLLSTRVDGGQAYLHAFRPDCAAADPAPPADQPNGGNGGGGEQQGGPTPSGTVDRDAPVLTNVRLKRKRFRRATTLTLRSSEAATLTLVVDRVGPRARRATITRRIKAGPNRIRLTTRVGKRRVRRGKHRLTLVARDAAGNASKPVKRRFAVIRRRRA